MMRFVVSAALAVSLVTIGAARAEEKLTVPGYAPKSGVAYVVRSSSIMTNAFDGSGTLPKGEKIDRLDLRHRQVATSTASGTWREVWTLDLDGAAARAALGRAEPTSPTDAYRRSMSIWGAERLELDVDAAGMATKLLGTDAILARARAELAAVPGGAGETSPAAQIVAAFAKEPLTLLDILLPEHRIFAALQAPAAHEVTVGATWTQEGGDVVRGVPLPKKTIFVVDGLTPDRRAVSVSWHDEIDHEDLSRTFAPLLDQGIAALRARGTEPTAAQRAALGEVRLSNAGRVVISLDTGMAIAAEHTRSARFGEVTTTVVSKIERLPE
ncbi:MAG: hypothetical protein ABTQ29_07485 [Siculibacillus sp.]